MFTTDTHVVCGAINTGDIASIQCNPDTGECYFYDELGSARLISGIILKNPIDLDCTEEPDEDLGYIESEEGYYRLIDEDTAVFEPVDSDEAIVIAISLDADYEDDED